MIAEFNDGRWTFLFTLKPKREHFSIFPHLWDEDET